MCLGRVLIAAELRQVLPHRDEEQGGEKLNEKAITLRQKSSQRIEEGDAHQELGFAVEE